MMLSLGNHRLLLSSTLRRVGRSFTNSIPLLSSSSTSTLTSEHQNYLKLHDVTIRGNNGVDYPPMTSFDDTPYPPSIIQALYSEGFTQPTPTQAQSWPIALAGKDMISIARTGSGKTCAFLLPGFLKALHSKAHPSPHATHSQRYAPRLLVLAPTRELTQQIVDEALKFSHASGLVVVPFYGGTPKGPQLRQLSRGVDVVVGTPGRINDLIQMGAIDLSMINYLVLDEADRMLDMGFEPQIRQIINRCNPERQNLFFTATWPKDIAMLARDYLTNPVSVHIGDADTLNANKAITQTIHVVKEYEKAYKLEEVMDSIIPKDPNMSIAERRRNSPKTLIFLSRKLECDDLGYELRDLGYLVGTLHGDKEQTARTKIMNKFRTGEIRVLVATDVAARGIDIKDIEVVINYDFPSGKTSGVEDYVHRIGRTARGERTGIAHTFFTPDNASAAHGLIQVLERCGQVVPNQLRALSRPSQQNNNRSPPRRNSYDDDVFGGFKKSMKSNDDFDPIKSGGGNRRRLDGPPPSTERKSFFNKQSGSSQSSSSSQSQSSRSSPAAIDSDEEFFNQLKRRGNMK